MTDMTACVQGKETRTASMSPGPGVDGCRSRVHHKEEVGGSIIYSQQGRGAASLAFRACVRTEALTERERPQKGGTKLENLQVNKQRTRRETTFSNKGNLVHKKPNHRSNSSEFSPKESAPKEFSVTTKIAKKNRKLDFTERCAHGDNYNARNEKKSFYHVKCETDRLIMMKNENASFEAVKCEGDTLANNAVTSSEADSTSEENPQLKEKKPSHSYISIISNAILSSPDKRLVLSDIYDFALGNYPCFSEKGPGWRNSIRHNLSLNDCFIKAGRSPDGKGHFWAINPLNYDDFRKGDFRRRRNQRKTRKEKDGFSINDRIFEGPIIRDFQEKPHFDFPVDTRTYSSSHFAHFGSSFGPSLRKYSLPRTHENSVSYERHQWLLHGSQNKKKEKRRGFDVESLLKPDEEHEERPVTQSRRNQYDCYECQLIREADLQTHQWSVCFQHQFERKCSCSNFKHACCDSCTQQCTAAVHMEHVYRPNFERNSGQFF